MIIFKKKLGFKVKPINNLILIICSFLFLYPVANAQMQLKIATLAPQNSDWAEKFQEGSEKIQRRTQNRVKLKFYWGGAQGNAKKNLQKIKIGQLHGGTFSPTDFQDIYPDLNIYGLPFLFKDFDEIEYVRKLVDLDLESGFKKLGYEMYGFAGGGFAYVMSNEPISGYDDLKNQKIWLPQGDLISYEAMRSLELLPVPLPMTDVLTGLQTGLIDIVAIPAVVALALQWHTKIKYITRIPVLYAMGFLAIDSRVINRLSIHDRNVISEVLRSIYEEVNAGSKNDSENAMQALLNIGIKEVPFHDNEYKRLTNLMIKPNLEMAKRDMFSLELFEDISNYIIEYRANLALQQ